MQRRLRAWNSWACRRSRVRIRVPILGADSFVLSIGLDAAAACACMSCSGVGEAAAWVLLVLSMAIQDLLAASSLSMKHIAA
ncbi:hypothetical protein D9M73_223570 [compost metagenome]